MSVIVQLRNYTNEASAVDKQIIQYMLSNMDAVINQSIHEIAKITYTSPASITRLAKKIGYSGYKELRNNLVSEVTIRDYKAVLQGKEVTQNDTFHNVLEKCLGLHILALEDTKALMDAENLSQIILSIKKSKVIYLFGIGSSFLVAKDFQQKLLRLGKPCILSEDFHMQILQSQSITSNDAAIVFSYSGQTHEMVQCCENIKNCGAKLIAITKVSKSKLDKLSDLRLYVSNHENIVRSGALASRSSMLYVVDVIYMSYIAHEYENALQNINKTQIEKDIEE